jgi:hypothetical protein
MISNWPTTELPVALQTTADTYKLSVGRELKMEIRMNPSYYFAKVRTEKA